MSIKVYLPDNSIIEYPIITYKPKLGKSTNRCFNPTMTNCISCNKCLHDKIVEMSEDGTEVWIEFVEENTE